MEHIPNRIIFLIKKLEKGAISPEEKSELISWYNSFDDSKTFIQEEEQIIKSRILSGILDSTNQKRSLYTLPVFKWASVAAIILAILVFSHHYITRQSTSHLNQPTLGASITVSSDTKSITQFHSEIINIYDLQKEEEYESEQAHMSVEIDRGKYYKLELSDQSIVWLNSDSRLDFPVEFDSDSRHVTLVGEAYFEVKPDSLRPFIIKTSKQQIEVLGTSFNVQAYKESNFERTSVTEGKVSVSPLAGDERIILSNSQSATVDTVNMHVIQETNSDFGLWREHIFVFERESVKEIVYRIARWYNLEVSPQNVYPDKRLSGKLKKDSTLKNILEMIELSAGIKLEIKKKTLFIH